MQSIIVTTLYLLTTLVPLILTTINSELFEFPKFLLLLSGSLVILIAWAIHIYQTRDYHIFEPSALSYSILAVLATQAVATLFSLHPYTSFWGYYSRFHGGLLTTICYTIIFFAVAKWMNKKSVRKLIKISIGTAFFISLYAIAERLGIDKNFWVQDVQNRVFSTLGQPNWLAAYLIPNLFLVLYSSQIDKAKSEKNLLYHFLFAILFLALLFTKSRSGFIGFGLAFVTYYFLLERLTTFIKIKTAFVSSAAIMVLLASFVGTPFTPTLSTLLKPKVDAPPSIISPSGTALEIGGTESGDIRKIVWQGALTLIKQHPILGTGSETFAYTYYNVRPLSHNQTSEWDFLYNKAHNEYLNLASGAGILALLAYLYYHLVVFQTSLVVIPKSKKVQQDDNLELGQVYPVLGATIVGFTVTNFFGFSVIPVYLITMIISALPSAMMSSKPIISPSPKTIWYFVLALPLIYSYRLFLADIYYLRGKNQNDISLLQKAIALRPGLDLFHAQLGETAATTGQIDLAIGEAQLSKTLNPYHLNFYKSRAKTYLTLASQDPQYYLQAAQELEEARSLAPTDPKLAYNLGLVYTRLSNTDRAATALQDAITLKPSYPEPYYALTLLYEQTKQTDKLPDLLTAAKSNLATYSAQLKEKIEKYTK